MSTQDVIKKTVYEMFAGGSDMQPGRIIFLLAASAVLGLYLFAVYKNLLLAVHPFFKVAGVSSFVGVFFLHDFRGVIAGKVITLIVYKRNLAVCRKLDFFYNTGKLVHKNITAYNTL